jgi:hypothetical protein
MNEVQRPRADSQFSPDTEKDIRAIYENAARWGRLVIAYQELLSRAFEKAMNAKPPDRKKMADILDQCVQRRIIRHPMIAAEMSQILRTDLRQLYRQLAEQEEADHITE